MPKKNCSNKKFLDYSKLILFPLKKYKEDLEMKENTMEKVRSNDNVVFIGEKPFMKF